MTMLRVYTASKLAKAPMWREIHDSWPHVFCHARWLKHTKMGTPDTPVNAEVFWVEDEADVKSADVVVVHATADEHLRGALVEAGMGIAFGKTVFVVGDHEDFGTWQYHPRVRRVASLGALREALEAYSQQMSWE